YEDEVFSFVACRYSIIPAVAVNPYGPATVQDHEFSRFSRPDLVKCIANWETQAKEETYATIRDHLWKRVGSMRNAVRLFDEVGWPTTVIPGGEVPQMENKGPLFRAFLVFLSGMMVMTGSCCCCG